MGFTNSESIEVLQDVMKSSSLALLTSANDNGTFSEVSIKGYQRCQISTVTTETRACKNADLILMFEAREEGRAQYFGFINSSGRLRFWGEINPVLEMSDGTVPVIRAGELKLEVLPS